MAAADDDLVQIEVGDRVYSYSMTVTPPEDSAIVLREKEGLTNGVLDLKSFVEDLGRLGKYVRVAYNGIGAAGPKFQDLQNEVQRLGFDISKLCDKSAVTIFNFKTTTRTVLFELKAAYQFLLRNKSKMALNSFVTLGKLAGKMAKAAEDLQKEFEHQQKKVEAALENISNKKAEETIRIKDIAAEQDKIEEAIETQKRLAMEYEKLENEERDKRHRYERKADKAISKSGSGFWGSLGNIITKSFGLGSMFDDGSKAAAKASQWRQLSIDKLENEKAQRKLKQDALQQMAELMHELKFKKEDKELSDLAGKALHKASLSVREIISLLGLATLFWNQIKDQCQRLADDGLKDQIETYIAEYPEDCVEYWSSDLFKEQMFIYISKWVALHSVSSTYMKQIKLTQKDLYEYMKDNPTYQESKDNLQQLVSEFEKDLKAAQEDIKEQNFKTDKEIQKLKDKKKADETKEKDEL